MLENKLGITSSPALAEAEERISKKKAVELFESGVLDTLEAGKFASLQTIHAYGGSEWPLVRGSVAAVRPGGHP